MILSNDQHLTSNQFTVRIVYCQRSSTYVSIRNGVCATQSKVQLQHDSIAQWLGNNLTLFFIYN